MSLKPNPKGKHHMNHQTKRPYGTRCRQGVFNSVATHLMIQRRPSTSTSSTGCPYYRGRDGLQCAIGCLIYDEHYSPAIEGHVLRRTGPVLQALIDSGVATDEPGMWSLLGELQEVHDDVVTMEGLTASDDARSRWIVSLDEVAQVYGLDSSVLDPWRYDPVAI